MRQQAHDTPRQPSQPRSGGISAAVAIVARVLDLVDRRVFEPRRRSRQRRAQLDLMMGLSGRALADIGLLRGDVHAVSWGGVPARQVGARHGPAGVTMVCCEVWPRSCTCAPSRPRRPEPQVLPEAA